MKNEEISKPRAMDDLDDWETFQKEEDCVRDVIFMYKTKECMVKDCVNADCWNYHGLNERRRRPFVNGKIKYSSDICIIESCVNSECRFSHNEHEQNFHPRIYKTKQCSLGLNNFEDKENENNQAPNQRMKNARDSHSAKSNQLPNFSIKFNNNSNRGSAISNVGDKLNFETIHEAVSSLEDTPCFTQIKKCDNTMLLGIPPLNLSNCITQTPHNPKLCPYYHSNEERRDHNLNQQIIPNSNSFLLTLENLSGFKTQKCKNNTKHSEKQCIFYHSLKDKRRSLDKSFYSPELCPIAGYDKYCRDGDFCSKSHNQVEMFYHKEKFKTKFCSFYSSSKSIKMVNNDCPYGTVCSFAHCEQEIRIELIHKLEKNEDFYLYYFKTIVCPFDKSHDKSACSYAHNLQDYRRNPKRFIYDKKNCSKWDNKKTILSYLDGCCYGYNCKFSHGWKEQDFHPLTYKTTKCKYFKEGCDKLEACPFYHKNEIRR